MPYSTLTLYSKYSLGKRTPFKFEMFLKMDIAVMGD